MPVDIAVQLQMVVDGDEMLALVVEVAVDDVLKSEYVVIALVLVVLDGLHLLHVAMLVGVGPVLEVEDGVNLEEADDVVLIQVTVTLEGVAVLPVPRKSDADQNLQMEDTALQMVHDVQKQLLLIVMQNLEIVEELGVK